MNGVEDRISPSIQYFQTESEYLPTKFVGLFEKETNDLIRKNWTAIRNFHVKNRFSEVYNLRVENNDIISALNSPNVQAIFQQKTKKFKCNTSIGYILINQNEEKLRY